MSLKKNAEKYLTMFKLTMDKYVLMSYKSLVVKVFKNSFENRFSGVNSMQLLNHNFYSFWLRHVRRF